MADKKAPNGIVLFHYPFSPFARRVVWYLQLRGIEYAECIQPFMMPRPDLEQLGIRYRRIPLMSIGRDVYLDTRLIIRKLEEKFPDNKLGAKKPHDKFIEGLLEKYNVEGPVFWAATGLVPSSRVQDPKFVEDRKGFCNRDWRPEALDEGRGECMAYVRNCFEFLENTVLADGRSFVLGSEHPLLADIEAIWPLDWLVEMDSMSSDVVSAKHYPKVYAWIERFRAALEEAKASAPKPTSLEGADAVQAITMSDFAESEGDVEASDPLEIAKGTEVEVYPSDWGSDHRDTGCLVSLKTDEVTVGTKSKGTELRIHAPRTGFSVTQAGKNGGSTKL